MLLVVSSFCGQTQFSVEFDPDTNRDAEVFDDVWFTHVLRNETDSLLEMKWRLFSDFSNTPEWDEYMIEFFWCGVFSSSFSFTLDTIDSMAWDQHIMLNEGAGTGSSKICFFEPKDSLNTVRCATMTVNAVYPDTYRVYVDTGFVYVINGDTHIIYEGEYAPLGVEMKSEQQSKLGQNVPNPFTGSSTINCTLEGSTGEIVIHDIKGNLVQKHILDRQHGTVRLGRGLKPGIYIYTLCDSGDPIDSRRMQVLE
jgi:hypothetical protein